MIYRSNNTMNSSIDSRQVRSINFGRNLSKEEVASLENGEQYYSDCYLMSSIDALARTSNGAKILSNNINRNDDNSNIISYTLHKPNGELIKYVVNLQNVGDKYSGVLQNQKNQIIQGLDITINEYESKYKTKPWYCALGTLFKHYRFENYLPSKFMEIMTGKKPISICENKFNINLKNHKEEVMELFSRMEKEKDYSFVITNGIKKHNGRRFHVYVIENVDLKNNTITIKNKRGNQKETFPSLGA